MCCGSGGELICPEFQVNNLEKNFARRDCGQTGGRRKQWCLVIVFIFMELWRRKEVIGGFKVIIWMEAGKPQGRWGSIFYGRKESWPRNHGVAALSKEYVVPITSPHVIEVMFLLLMVLLIVFTFVHNDVYRTCGGGHGRKKQYWLR